MMAAELDRLLETTCDRCGRVYRLCKCAVRPHIAPSVPEDTAAAAVSAAWLTGDQTGDLATALRVWARYRRMPS